MDQLFLTSLGSSTPTVLLPESLVMSIKPKLPWACETVGFLLQRNIYFLIREIVLTGKLFPYLKRVVEFSKFCSILTFVVGHAKVIPVHRSAEFPRYACLLGNVMETASLAFAPPDCSFDLAMGFAVVAASLLEELSLIQTIYTGSEANFTGDEDEMIIDEEFKEKVLQGLGTTDF